MKSETELKKVFDWKKSCKIVGFYRRSLNLTKANLAGLLGVMPSTVGVWERGIKEPKASSLVNLAQVFGVSETELLHPSEEVQKKMVQMGL